MAGASPDYHRGEMEISEQVKTYHFVMGMTKWGSLALAAALLWLVLWFCVPGAGFLAGFITAVVVTAIGIFVLREKGDAH